MGVEKMKRFVLGLGCVAGLVLLPSIASAALSLNINGPGSGTLPGGMDALSVPGGPGTFDLVFAGDTIENGQPVNEGLFAYDLLLTVPQAMQGKFRITGADDGGPVSPGTPDPNFVLGADRAKYTFSVAERDDNHVLVNVSSNNDLFDISAGKKAGRILYTVDLGTSGSSLAFDPNSTVFGSGDPNRPLQIDVGLTDTGVVGVIPEPTSLSLLGIAGLLALRRRRAA